MSARTWLLALGLVGGAFLLKPEAQPVVAAAPQTAPNRQDQTPTRDAHAPF